VNKELRGINATEPPRLSFGARVISTLKVQNSQHLVPSPYGICQGRKRKK